MIASGIRMSIDVFFSINIFFIAGSSNQAIKAVVREVIITNKKIIKISLNYFLICVLNILIATS